MGLILVILVAGFVAGWLASSLRARGSENAKLGTDRAVPTKRIRLYELKCKCGAVAKFRGADDTGPSELPTFPDGDSYTCPACGAAVDLKKVRELIQDATEPR